MPTKLADTRTLRTDDDARQQFAAVARAEIEIEKVRAAEEARIAAVKAEAAAQLAPLAAERDRLAAPLTAYICVHADRFVRPRAVKTDFGRFGLRTVSNVEIGNRDLVEQWALSHGYDDCVIITRRLSVPALRKRLNQGDSVPTTEIVTGDEAFYSVDRELIDRELRNNQ